MTDALPLCGGAARGEFAGTAQSGSRVQTLGQFGFAGTTDNQMQLTLPRALCYTGGNRPASGCSSTSSLRAPPALPACLEPEGNGYRVRLSYAPSGEAVEQLDAPATLGLSAPAPAIGCRS